MTIRIKYNRIVEKIRRIDPKVDRTRPISRDHRTRATLAARPHKKTRAQHYTQRFEHATFSTRNISHVQRLKISTMVLLLNLGLNAII